MSRNKVAIVTGGGQGIGHAICTLLSRDYSVAVCDINEETALHTAQDCGGTAYPFDISKTETIPTLVDQIYRDLGTISALVNCAGVCRTEPISAMTPEGFRHTFSVNVDGAFFLSRACAELMQASGTGSIVNIASVSGFIPKLEQVAYGASKAALVSLTRSMALIYGQYGIRVNAVAPGVIDTPLTSSISELRSAIRGISPEETLAPVIDSLPLQRIGTPQEVAEAVAFLISEHASYITGQTLDVCGGQLMR